MASLVVALVVAAGAYELTRSGSSSPAASPVAPAATPTTPIASAPQAGAPSLPVTVRLAIADALAQRSVRLRSRSTSPKAGVVRFDQIIGLTNGVQRISIYGGSVTVRVVGPTTFFTGDERGLQKYMGFSAPMARQIVGHWLELEPGQTGYAAVTADVTLSSALKEIEVTGPLHRLPARTRDGQSVFGIRGRPPGNHPKLKAVGTLWISVSRNLPVEYDIAATGATERDRFTDWGGSVDVPVPPNVLHLTQPPSTSA